MHQAYIKWLNNFHVYGLSYSSFYSYKVYLPPSFPIISLYSMLCYILYYCIQILVLTILLHIFALLHISCITHIRSQLNTFDDSFGPKEWHPKHIQAQGDAMRGRRGNTAACRRHARPQACTRPRVCE